MDAELMLALHTRVHREIKGDGHLLSGLKGRRTDDGARRSAALHEFDSWLAQNHQVPVADIPDGEDGLDRCIESDIAVVDHVLRDRHTRRTGYGWDRT
jgi:hypothetical protein